jgi:RimJ/RimL family protein N-acetyltransferase
MIETERLVLSRPQIADFEPVAAMWADPAVTQFITPQPLERRQCWINLLYHAGHWDLLGYGGWSVREKATGEFVGQVGFQKFVRGIDAEREHLPEAGWVLRPSMQGRGYAFEATKAMIAWADTTFPADTTMAIVNDMNAASLKLAAKLGYRERTKLVHSGVPITVFERVRPSGSQATLASR